MAQDLFLALAEQVKLPLTQILHAAELLDDETSHRQTITTASQSALRLIDSYLLAVQLQREGQLQFEPVPVSSLLYDTAEALQPVAEAHGCEIELHIAGKYAPVMSHNRALSAALASMGQSFIEAVSTSAKPKQRVIRLAVRRVPTGISAGIFTAGADLTSDLLKRARELQGRSHQPMAGFTSEAAAGIFVADQLFSQLEAPMRVAHMRGLSGLAATFAPSRQLNLV